MRHIEVNEYDHKGLTAKLDFRFQLLESPELRPILGRYDVATRVNEYGERLVTCYEAAFPMHQSGFYAFCPEEENQPVGFISVIDDAPPAHFTEVSKLQHVWIDRRFSGRGYGKRLMEIVTSAATNTNEKCRSGELPEPCFSLLLFPRPFDLPEDFDLAGLVDGVSDFDVSIEALHDGYQTKQKSISDVMQEENINQRPDVRGLVDFYVGLGFGSTRFFLVMTKLDKGGFYTRDISVLPETFVSHIRPSLVFPAENISYWDAVNAKLSQVVGKTPHEVEAAGLTTQVEFPGVCEEQNSECLQAKQEA